jgi:hypothetical protein
MKLLFSCLKVICVKFFEFAVGRMYENGVVKDIVTKLVRIYNPCALNNKGQMITSPRASCASDVYTASYIYLCSYLLQDNGTTVI